MKARFWWWLPLPLALHSLAGQSSIDPGHAFAWSANAGWINAAPAAAPGMKIGAGFCWGYWHCANLGWINLGNGLPANGIAYSNSSAADFGVNLDPAGNLRGYAYGANIGWIAFEPKGAPRLDLTSGQFSGAAYSANVGWIALSGASFFLRATGADPGIDSNGNGLPDAWELRYAGNLTTFTRTSDLDGNGESDYDKYVAGIDPTDPKSIFRVTEFQVDATRGKVILSWPTAPFRQYQVLATDGLGTGTWAPITPSLTVSNQTSLRIEAPLPPGASANNFFRVRVSLLRFP